MSDRERGSASDRMSESDNYFVPYDKKADEETIYDMLANIHGALMIDFEEAAPNEYFVIKSKDGTYCVRTVFKIKEYTTRKRVYNAEGDMSVKEFIEKRFGYILYAEYSGRMGKHILSERLFSKLKPYRFNTEDKRLHSRVWRGSQSSAIEAKKRVKLRVGDILRVVPPIRLGDPKKNDPSVNTAELKCISLAPLRFANVVLRGCVEEYDGSYYVPRAKIAERNFEFLERGKPSRDKAPVCKVAFSEVDHLNKIAEAIAKLPPAEPPKPRKKREGPIGLNFDEVINHKAAVLKMKERGWGKYDYEAVQARINQDNDEDDD